MKTVNDNRILVVDDNDDIRMLLKLILEEAGHSVSVCENGNAAIRLLSEKSFSIVISDVQMPNGTGVELLEHLLQQPLPSPIFLFISGFADFSIEEALDKGAYGIIPKPWDSLMLVEVVQRLLLPIKDRWSIPSAPTNEAPPVAIHPSYRLGRGGMIVSGTAPVKKIGEKFSFSILEGQDETLSGVGRLEWQRPDAYGFSFLEIAPNHLPDFLKKIDSLKTRAVIPINIED